MRLEELTSLESIHAAAFGGCTSLGDITLSARLLYRSPFYKCTKVRAAFNEDLLIGTGFEYPMMLYKTVDGKKTVTVPFADMLEVPDIGYIEGKGVVQQPQDVIKVKDKYAQSYLFDGYSYGVDVDFSRFTYSLDREINGTGDYTLNLSYQYACNSVETPTLTKTLQIPFKVIDHVHSTGQTGDIAATCQKQAYCSVCKTYYGEISQHEYSYKATDNVITGTCSYSCGHKATVTLTAPTGIIYDGEAKTVTVKNTIDETDYSSQIVYKDSEGNEVTEVVNAGTYTANLTIEIRLPQSHWL